MRFDLHIHSCLSPCADLEMSPRAIVERALAAGLDAIAITDHNSARNTPALADCCRESGLAALFGLEISTAEEVHTLALFDTLAQAASMTEWIYDSLPKRVNQPEVFGDQPVVTADETIIELEWRLLAGASRHTVREVGAKVHELGGLFIAAHIDRPVFSLFSQLGLLADDEGFDALELSRFADAALWRERSGGLPLLRSSDSHYLADIGSGWSEAELETFSVAGLQNSLQQALVQPGPPLKAGR